MLYYFALYLVRTLLMLRCSLEIEGLEHIPVRGGGFLVSNHRSVLDPVVIGASVCKRKIRFMAKKELFNSWAFRILIQKLGAFPVDREFTDRHFIRQVCQDLSEHQQMILIFGEGTRNLDKSKALMPIKPGFAFLAKRAQVSIIPMYVSGIHQLMQPVWRPRVMVSFAPPIRIEDIREAVQATQNAMEDMAEKHRQKLNKSNFA